MSEARPAAGLCYTVDAETVLNTNLLRNPRGQAAGIVQRQPPLENALLNAIEMALQQRGDARADAILRNVVAEYEKVLRSRHNQ